MRCHRTDGHLVLKTDWINLCAEFGWDERRIPRRMRDPTEAPGIGWCGSLALLYATVDPRPGGSTVDPRSGGIIGWRRFREALGGVSQRTARRIIKEKPYGKSVQMVDGIPATTCTTGTEIRRLHDLDVSEAHRLAGQQGGRPPLRDQAPGSTCLANTQPIIETEVREPQASEGRVWGLPGP
jgi:hypothetical protein